jgi:hypothetical protein
VNAHAQSATPASAARANNDNVVGVIDYRLSSHGRVILRTLAVPWQIETPNRADQCNSDDEFQSFSQFDFGTFKLASRQVGG